MSQELKALADELRWYIENRWTVEEQQEDALLAADKLIALINDEAVAPELSSLPENGPEESIPSDDYAQLEWLVPGETFPIVGKRFTRDEFAAYVQWVQANEPYTWSPSGITMHHTGYPDLATRPDGFTEQHMRNMHDHYKNDKKWSHGPHIFTDDHGIWVFNPLSQRGVHAVSFNAARYGIEMLGNFDSLDDFDDERGIASRANGQFAAAVLMKYAGISTGKLNFHRFDPETSKRCPGRHVAFSTFEEEVLAIVENV